MCENTENGLSLVFWVNRLSLGVNLKPREMTSLMTEPGL